MNNSRYISPYKIPDEASATDKAAYQHYLANAKGMILTYKEFTDTYK